MNGPLLIKPVNGQELFFAVSHSKPALERDLFIYIYLVFGVLDIYNFDGGHQGWFRIITMLQMTLNDFVGYILLLTIREKDERISAN